MVETWMFSVVFAARPGLPLGVASASCCCADVLKKLSKKKDPRKEGREGIKWLRGSHTGSHLRGGPEDKGCCAPCGGAGGGASQAG